MSSPVSLKNDDYKKGNYALPKIVFKFLVLNKSIEHFDSWLLDAFKCLAFSFVVKKDTQIPVSTSHVIHNFSFVKFNEICNTFLFDFL